MSRRRVLAGISGWTLVDAGELDGVVVLDPRAREGRLTQRTWWLSGGDPQQSARLLEGLHAAAADPTGGQLQVVLDPELAAASLEHARQREQFRARRRRRRPTQAAAAPVVSLTVLRRQRRRVS